MKTLRDILPAVPVEAQVQILNHACRRASLILAVSVVVSTCLFLKCDTIAPSDLPAPKDPWLAGKGGWAADFNEAQIACYNGSMRACDSIWRSDRVLFDTWPYDYGRSCGGRVDRRQISRAGVSCAETFPSHD